MTSLLGACYVAAAGTWKLGFMAYPALIAAAAVLGALLLRPFRLGSGIEAWTFRLLAGFCLAAVLVLMLGLWSLRTASAALYLIAACGLAAEIFSGGGVLRTKGGVIAAPVPLTWLERLCAGTVGMSLLLTFLSALAPVTSWDAGVAHLALPDDYARAGRIYFEPGNVYSGYPHLLHGLYAVACFSGGEQTAALLSWTFGGLACAALYVLGSRIESRRCGWIAAALLGAAPIFMDQAGTVSIDLAFTALVAGALAALAAWRADGSSGRLLLTALLAGSACGVRHTGLLVLALLAPGVLLLAPRRRVVSVAVFAGVAALAAFPWLFRSAWLTGNPVFPLLDSVFPAGPIPHISVTDAAPHESIARGGGARLLTFLRFPWDIVMRPGQYDGWTKSPGGMVLILGVPGLIFGGAAARLLGVFSIAGGVVFFFFQRLARYLLPFFAPMMVVAGVAACRAPAWRRLIAAILVAAFLYGLGLHVAAMHFKAPVLLGLQTRDAYLRERVERYPAFEYINEGLNDGRTVLTPDQRTYYIEPPTFQNHWEMLRVAGLAPEQQRAWLRDHHIGYVLVPWAFLEESPAIRDALIPMFKQWRADPVHFRSVREFVFPKLRGTGEDRVDIYEVVQD